jgi:hypothetical protein
MKTWQIFLTTTLLTLCIGGVYLFTVWKHRHEPGAMGQNGASQALSDDDAAVVRTEQPEHFEDTLRLQGTTVWMKNGYTMWYYPYAGGQVEFSRRVGVIPALERLDIKRIVKSAVPANEYDGMGHGSRQAFAVFALPGSGKLFATPIGTMQGSEEAYYCDLLFYYDDPHGIYTNWPKDVWAAIDAHQVIRGMSELQTRLSIGQKREHSSNAEGDRTVTYDQAGKHWTVTYVENRATAIESR